MTPRRSKSGPTLAPAPWHVGSQLLDREFSNLRDATSAAKALSATDPHVIVEHTDLETDQAHYFVYDVQKNATDALPKPGTKMGPPVLSDGVQNRDEDAWDDIILQRGDELYREECGLDGDDHFVVDGTA